MKNSTRIQQGKSLISKHITATRLRDKLAQNVVNSTLTKPKNLDVSRVFLHSDGSMTGRVKISGKFLDVRYDNSINFWKYQSAS